MPVQAFRAARLLPSSQHALIHDGAVVVDTDTGKILGAGSWDSIAGMLIDEASVEDLGDVTLMPGKQQLHN